MLTTRTIARSLSPWRSIAFKLTLFTSLFVLAVIGLMARRILQATESGLLSEMQLRGEFFARSSREALFPKTDAFQLHFQVEQMLKEKAVTSAAVLDAQGRVLSHSDPARIGQTLGDTALQSPRATLAERGDAYDIWVPILVGPRRVGTAWIGFSRDSVRAALAATKRQIALIALAFTGAAILGTVLIVGWLLRPLPRLAEAAKKVGRGDFTVQVDWTSEDEIGLLARAFNEMTIANALLFKTIRQEKEKLETIFHDTAEGLIWADPLGRVLLINPAARALLGCRERAVDSVHDAAAGFSARPPLGAVLGGRARVTGFELERREPKLLILAGVADRLGPEKEPSGYLLVFRDATLEKRGETLARNFLSLVSHKLRTPLAVALGFVEILQGDQKNLTSFQKEALEKIRAEDEKLRKLVERLIAFSTVQSPENIVLDRAEMSLAEAVDQAVAPYARDKTVALSWDGAAAAKLPKVKGDAMLLKEAVANLVENAVKFNRKGKKSVAITLSRQNGSLRLAVADDGPGIPGEEQPKLFRRFYQIDADFTGQIPGMGLGLAFVKNVVEAHGGQAGLRSEPGKGSEFYFTVPIG